MHLEIGIWEVESSSVKHLHFNYLSKCHFHRSKFSSLKLRLTIMELLKTCQSDLEKMAFQHCCVFVSLSVCSLWITTEMNYFFNFHFGKFSTHILCYFFYLLFVLFFMDFDVNCKHSKCKSSHFVCARNIFFWSFLFYL